MAALHLRRLMVPVLAALATRGDGLMHSAPPLAEEDAVVLLQVDRSSSSGSSNDPALPESVLDVMHMDAPFNVIGASERHPEGPPKEIVDMLMAAEGPTKMEAQQQGPNDKVQEQQVARWVAALFSNKPAGEAIDASNDEQFLEKLTGYALKEEGKPLDKRANWTEEDPPELFFTSNRLLAMERALAKDRQDVKKHALVKGELSRPADSKGVHAEYSREYDLLPEPGHEEEEGQKWHIELSHTQQAGQGSVSILGHGLVRHFHAEH